MLLGGHGNLGVAFAHLRHGTGNLCQCFAGLPGLPDTVVGLVRAFLHELHCISGARLQGGDHGGDLVGGVLHALGQVTYFIGHHGKAAAQVAGARCFDGGIERQQVGLFGDAVDHADNAIDLLTVFSELANHLGSLLNAAGQPGNRILHPADHLLAATGQGIGGL